MIHGSIVSMTWIICYIAYYIDSGRPPPVRVLFGWLCVRTDLLFGGLFSVQTTARVWDALLLEGHKVAQRTALAILRRFDSTICSSSDPMQLRKIIDSRAGRLDDAEGLMSTAFKGIGSMPGVHLGVLRARAQREVHEQAQARQQAMALLAGCRIH